MKLKDKIIVGTSGGLGNQMFQYAAGLSLSNKLGIPLKLDISWHNGKVSRKYLLNNLNISNVECSFSRKNYFLELYQQYKKRFSKKFMGVPIFRERFFHFSKDFNAINSPVFLHGYWQSEKYFEKIKKTILKEFKLKTPLPRECRQLEKTIQKSNSICLHIRRGDYMSKNKKNIHRVLTPDYYKKALRILNKDFKNPCCFVFSDDIGWIKNNIKLEIPFILVDFNSVNYPHFDLHLMSQCKKFIIANSSLSWWGAWLSEYRYKEVIAPKKWFSKKNIITSDLIPESWKLI